MGHTQSDTERKRKAHDSAAGARQDNAMNGQMAYSRQLGHSRGHSHGHGRVIDDRFEVLDTLGTGYSGK